MNKLVRLLCRNPVMDTLIHLKGNGRACLWTEPLWGIPYNLYTPFVSVYMAQLGMSPTQIGLVSTLFFLSQVVWSLLSGPLTDKLGRRVCTVIFDVLSWSVPCLIWMCAQSYVWFIVAAVFNGAWRVTENSWGLLMAEEAPEDKLVHMYSITHIAGLVAGFIAPLAYFFVQEYSVVPTMRALYFLSFVMMTAKFLILFRLSHETPVGLRRMADTKDQSLTHYLADSPRILFAMLKEPRTMLTVGLIACYTTVKTVSTNFWPLLVTDKLGIAAENLSVFSTLKSILMLAMYFLLVPHIRVRRFRRPLLLALFLLSMIQVLMILMPTGAYALVVLGVLAEAAAVSVLDPLTSSLQMVNSEAEQRARILGWFYALCLAVTAPFGVIAGVLSEINRALPFYLNLALLLAAVVLSIRLAAVSQREENAAEASL